jgi:very-short-patch-repair endonuclease
MGNVRQPNRRQRIPKARHLRREVTEPERKLWKNLRQLPVGASHFRRQSPIGPYFADFTCHQKRIVIEIDGETHASVGAAAHDESRSAYFHSNGYRVLRFWNYDVMSNIEGVMTVIQQAIGEQVVGSPPPLTPPHASRGRGMS